MGHLKTEHSGSKKGRGAYWGARQEAKQLSRKQRRVNDKLTHQRLIELGLEAPKLRGKKKPKGEKVPEYSVVTGHPNSAISGHLKTSHF